MLPMTALFVGCCAIVDAVAARLGLNLNIQLWVFMERAELIVCPALALVVALAAGRRLDGSLRLAVTRSALVVFATLSTLTSAYSLVSNVIWVSYARYNGWL